ncbi:MAG TPA: YihY/virulence factor BrkB family protein [Gaiella sp.]
MTSSAQRQDGPSGPFPELEEPKRADPGLRDLSFADWRAVLLRAGKESLDDNVPMMASALAYSAFFAIPSVLLLVLGVFTLVADQATITEIVDKLTAVAPEEVAKLFGQSLERLSERPSAGILLTVVGLVLALWSLSSAMSTVITALNVAYDRDDRRGFVRKRLTALGLGIAVGAAVLLAGTLLVLGPHLQSWLGGALDAQTAVAFVWWIGQWPLLVVALLLAFALVLFLAPDVDHPRWQLVTPGSIVAVVVWLLASGVFSLYTTWFGSYDKTWGTLGAVIVTMTWLWLGGMALLFGGELNAETERSRQLRERPGRTPEAASPPLRST